MVGRTRYAPAGRLSVNAAAAPSAAGRSAGVSGCAAGISGFLSGAGQSYNGCYNQFTPIYHVVFGRYSYICRGLHEVRSFGREIAGLCLFFLPPDVLLKVEFYAGRVDVAKRASDVFNKVISCVG